MHYYNNMHYRSCRDYTSVFLQCVWMLHFVAGLTAAYNVDLTTPQVLVGPSGSHLGYTVQFYTYNNGTYEVLTGAPKSNSSCQHTLDTPGSLYSCSVSSHNTHLLHTTAAPTQHDSNHTVQLCQQLCVDDVGNTMRRGGIATSYTELKDGMALGTSLAVDQNTDMIMVCGHLWRDIKYRNQYAVNGACYELRGGPPPMGEATKLLPLIHGRHQYTSDRDFKYMFGQAGTDVHYTKEPGRKVMGAPGVNNWAGALVEYRNSIHRVIDFPDLQRSSYAGYSVSSAHFHYNTEIYYVVGAPRADQTGKVMIFKANYESVTEKHGEQAGSYFGHTLLVSDVTADRLDDLIVSAPMYAGTHTQDVGRVYVYVCVGYGVLEARQVLEGSGAAGGRFGAAVAAVDLDDDGYNDLLVSAPYEDEGHGVLYTYNGYHGGVRSHYSQSIRSRDLVLPVNQLPRGCGISVAVNKRDVDKDIALGCYQSSSVLVLPTRPVAHVHAQVQILPSGYINLVQHNCERATKTCIAVKVQLTYDGGLHRGNVHLTYRVTVDSIRTSQGLPARGRLKERGGSHDLISNLTMVYGEMYTYSHVFIVKDPVEDYTTPLTVLLQYDIITEGRSTSSPVLYQHTPSTSHQSTASIPFLHICGYTPCVSNLTAAMTFMTSDVTDNTHVQADDNSSSGGCLVYSNSNLLYVNATVTNTGDDAYNARLQMQHSHKLRYQHTSITHGIQHVDCTAQTETDDNVTSYQTLWCYLGHPMDRGAQLNFMLVFTISELETSDTTVDITTHLMSDSKQLNSSDIDISYHETLCFHSDTPLLITGRSIPYSYYTEFTRDDSPPNAPSPQSPTNNITTTNTSDDSSYGNGNGGGDGELVYIRHVYDVMNGALWAVDNINITILLSGLNVMEGQQIRTFTVAQSGTDQEDIPEACYKGQQNSQSYNRSCDARDTCVVYHCLITILPPSAHSQITVYFGFNQNRVKLRKTDDGAHHSFNSDVTLHTGNDTVIAMQSVHTPIYKGGTRVPLWIIIVSSLSGVFLLTMFILLVHQCGFFRRGYKEEYNKLLLSVPASRIPDLPTIRARNVNRPVLRPFVQPTTNRQNSQQPLITPDGYEIPVNTPLNDDVFFPAQRTPTCTTPSGAAHNPWGKTAPLTPSPLVTPRGSVATKNRCMPEVPEELRHHAGRPAPPSGGARATRGPPGGPELRHGANRPHIPRARQNTYDENGPTLMGDDGYLLPQQIGREQPPTTPNKYSKLKR